MAPEKSAPLLLEAFHSLAEPRGLTQALLTKYLRRTRNVTVPRAALLAQRALRQGVTTGFVECKRKRYRLYCYRQSRRDDDYDDGDDLGAECGDDLSAESGLLKSIVDARHRGHRGKKGRRGKSHKGKAKGKGKKGKKGRKHSNNNSRRYSYRQRRILDDED